MSLHLIDYAIVVKKIFQHLETVTVFKRKTGTNSIYRHTNNAKTDFSSNQIEKTKINFLISSVFKTYGRIFVFVKYLSQNFP